MWMKALLVSTLLAGCASAPMHADGRLVTLADAGPVPEDQAAIVLGVLKEALRDPESAKVEIDRAPRRVIVSKLLERKGGAAWELCPLVNAKNAYGGYTGYKRVHILWNERVVDYSVGDFGDEVCRGVIPIYAAVER